MKDIAAMGPFERNGISPSYIGASAVVRIEAARVIVAYLAENGCLGDGLDWDNLPPMVRETWVDTLSTKYGEAHRAASKEAMTELAAVEERAMRRSCRKCYAEENEKCRDLRTNALTHNKHVHQERIDDLMAEEDL